MSSIRVFILGWLLIPALLCQSLFPILPTTIWESFDSFLYPFLVASPLPEHESNVVIVEVDEATMDRFGWPLPRSEFTRLLERLEQAGRPWILSLLQFQDLSDVGEFNLADPDLELAMAIEGYERYVGTGLVFREQAEGLSDEEEDLLAKQLLSLEGEVEFLPLLQVQLRESSPFLLAQQAFGFGAFFFAQRVVYCTELYVDSIQPGELVIPSALFWTLRHFTKAQMNLDNGIEIAGGSPAYEIAPQHCLKASALSTADYHQRYDIKTYSMLQALEGELPSLEGKALILAAADMTLHLGPGPGNQNVVKAPEHHLFSRFLDGLLERQTVARSNTASSLSKALPLYLAGILLAAIAVVGMRILLLLMIGLLMALVGLSFYWMNVENVFLLPSQGLTYMGVQLVGWGGSILGTQITGLLATARLRESLRGRLSQCITLEELEGAVGQILRAEIAVSNLQFRLDQGISARRDQVSQLKAGGSLVAQYEKPSTPVTMPKSEWQLTKVRPGLFSLLRRYRVLTRLRFLRDGRNLSEFSYELALDRWHLGFAKISARSIAHELNLHWHRIELLLEQMASDLSAIRMQQDLEMGEAVQRLFLPKTKSGRVGDTAFRVVFQPYGPMSGDWFQWYQSSKGLLIAIGDVVGKGPSAALNTAVIAAVWKQCQEEAHEPERLLATMNAIVFGLFEGKQNTTVSLAWVDQKNYTLVRAGSPPWFLGGQNGMKRLPVKVTNPVGMLEEFSCQSHHGEWQPGDCLLAFSDGVIEGHQATQRLCAEYQHHNNPDDNFLALEAAARTAGEASVLPDDFTLLMLQYAPK